MNRSDRDLLVLFKQELMSRQAIAYQVELLHELLYKVEQLDNIAAACELIDFNRYKIISKKHKVRDALRRTHWKPFVFLYCRN